MAVQGETGTSVSPGEIIKGVKLVICRGYILLLLLLLLIIIIIISRAGNYRSYNFSFKMFQA